MLRSIIIALVIAVAAVGWVLSGQVGPFADDGSEAVSLAQKQEAAAKKEPAEPKIMTVRTRVLTAQPRVEEIVARGRTAAFRRVELKAETPGRVVKIEAEKGARVSKGDVIVRLDAAGRYAQLTEAKALVRQRKIEYEAASKLSKKGFRAETKLAESLAYLDSAKAQVKQIQVDIARLTIHAPFDGVVDERVVEIGDYLKEGNPVATIVDEDPFLVIAQVSEREVTRVKHGDDGSARLVTGEEVHGKIRFVSTTADPATRTFRIELEVENQDHSLRDGMTAEIRIAVGQSYLHLVSPAVLTLDDDGVIGVRTVDDSNTVIFKPVEIIANDSSGVWLSGLPQTVQVITVGQEFVRQGDHVNVVPDQPAAAS
jgi:multidrug efflux system membrane fusion protein